MDKKIQEIRETLEAATPGKWLSTDDAVRILPSDSVTCVWICQMYEEGANDFEEIMPFDNAENNANFIANAPEYIAYLLQQIVIKDKELGFYADRENWRVGPFRVTEVELDSGRRARAALKGEDTNE
ncbi:hypothetical protein LWE69_11700 [Paenibacillus sp. UKAQ_18]|nr:hypothetical protein [Paenibacillus sp. UKAQ_18]